MNLPRHTSDNERLQRLVQEPTACFLADCERMSQDPNETARVMWLAAIGRGLESVEYGGYWWQTLLLNMTEHPDPAWTGAVQRLSQGTRPAAMTTAEREAGRLRYTVEAVRQIRDRLRSDGTDQRRGAVYAWMLWRASAATGLRITDLRAAEPGDGGELLSATGMVLLRRLSAHAREECKRLVNLRRRMAGNRGEEALYHAALQAWDRAGGGIALEECPALDSARHLSLAVWRRELDNPLLAVLLGEEEDDVLSWGQELAPGSELELHRPPPPPLRAAAQGFAVAETAIVAAMAIAMAGAGLELAAQGTWPENGSEAALVRDAPPGRARNTFNTAAAEQRIPAGGFAGARKQGGIAAQDFGGAQAGGPFGPEPAATAAGPNHDGGNAAHSTNCSAGAAQVILCPNGMESGNPRSEASADGTPGRLFAPFAGMVSADGVFCCLREE